MGLKPARCLGFGRRTETSLVDADAETPGVLHAHSLMWDHFGEQLAREHPEAWRTKVDMSSTEVTITMWRCVHDNPSRNPRIQIA